MKIKNTLLAAALALTLGTTSCLGPDNAYRQVANWNAGLSDQDWIDELVYIGMWIIPVYPIVLTGDILIFNTIGYWGDNPINDPGAFKGFTSKD